MKWEDYNKLKTLVDAELRITQDNVLRKSLDAPLIYHKYLDILINETKEYKTLNKILTEKHSVLYQNAKFKNNYQVDSKSDVDAFINADKEYLELKHQVDIQETILQYLEKLIDKIAKMSFDIKNFVEYSKFLAGK